MAVWIKKKKNGQLQKKMSSEIPDLRELISRKTQDAIREKI